MFAIVTLVSCVELCVEFLRNEYGGYQGADDESEDVLGGGCPGRRGVLTVALFIGYKFEAMRELRGGWRRQRKNNSTIPCRASPMARCYG